jgi:polysaccharide export outer membrane protein
MTFERRRPLLRTLFANLAVTGPLLFTAACTSVGPSTKNVLKSPQTASMVQGIRIIDVNETVARRLEDIAVKPSFASALGDAAPIGAVVGPGDILEVTIWEAPPAALFGSSVASRTDFSPETSRGTALPAFLVGPSGKISIPFAGMVPVAGLTLRQIEQEVTARLQGKAHLPQVMVRLASNATATVTVVGEVTKSTNMPLTPKGERLLDALAAAGGTKEAINKTSVQISRNGTVTTMPLEAVIGDPRQNIILRTGDVVTAFYQPYSFTVMGATGRNDEIKFESTGLTLAQALGRMGGLQDGRADPKGLFLFRWEDPALVPDRAGATTRPDGRVPVVYRVNLRDTATFFAMQHFAVRDKDVLFVSNSPVAEFQRFIGVVAQAFIPISTVDNALNRN